MGQANNLALAQRLLQLIGDAGADPDLVALFSPEAVVDIPGDQTALPWIGRRQGSGAMLDFLSGLRRLTEPVSFNVVDILASDARAVILVDMKTKVKATDRIIQSAGAIVLDVADRVITRFLLLEDSFEVSQKARPEGADRSAL